MPYSDQGTFLPKIFQKEFRANRVLFILLPKVELTEYYSLHPEN